MLEEIALDVANARQYVSDRLSPTGRADWEQLLRDAAARHDDDHLASELRRAGRLNAQVMRRKPGGGTTLAAMPRNAGETLAEGEFNRYYMRAVCRRAIEDGTRHVIVYRAKHAESPRPASQARIGALVDPNALLEDLRANVGASTVLGVPGGPNSGLSVELPQPTPPPAESARIEE